MCVSKSVRVCVLRGESASWTRQGAVIKISPGLSQSLSPLLKTKRGRESDGMLDKGERRQRDGEGEEDRE